MIRFIAALILTLCALALLMASLPLTIIVATVLIWRFIRRRRVVVVKR